jgi:hypothetical protein
MVTAGWALRSSQSTMSAWPGEAAAEGGFCCTRLLAATAAATAMPVANADDMPRFPIMLLCRAMPCQSR